MPATESLATGLLTNYLLVNLLVTVVKFTYRLDTKFLKVWKKIIHPNSEYRTYLTYPSGK